MDQEKIGQYIKKIRLDHNLSQQAFAEKLGVTFQAVSKWERGKNLPDMTILKEISNEFNVDIDEIINCGTKNKKKKSNKKYVYLILILVVIVFTLLFVYFNNKDKDNDNQNSYEVNDIISTNSDFSVTGTVVKANNRTTLIINKVIYIGKEDKSIYKEINCVVYEEIDMTKTEINSCDAGNNLSLSDYLDNIKIKVDHESDNCPMFTESKLVIEIRAIDNEDRNITYNIPIIINEDDCF